MPDVESYATVDFDRADRCGFTEVVYAEGKEPEQVAGIVERIVDAQGVAMATRVDRERADALLARVPDAVWAPRARIAYVDRRGQDGLPAVEGGVLESVDAVLVGGEGGVAVCCAGTSDLAVAEEAALTARLMGARTALVRDVGVAGVHRVLERAEELRSANAIVVVAGMEGALPSLVAGLVSVPVFAVPTSVGYGANLQGVTTLLSMMCSCAGGVSVVNIDNGFGAGQCAARVNRLVVNGGAR